VTLHGDHEARPDQAVPLVLEGAELYLPLSGLIDRAAERDRLAKELGQEQAEAARLSAKLANAGFVDRAPQAVVDKERERLAAAQERIGRLEARLRDVA
jgi:valyl-tRNA synthetase